MARKASPTGSRKIDRSEQQATHWEQLAAEIDRQNRSDPRSSLAIAERWVADERASGSAEGCARALRAHAHALRFLGMYETAVAQYDDAEARFQALRLEAEAAGTRIGHVTALRLLGRYQEAVDLAQQTRAYFLDRGDQLQAAKQAMNLGTIYRPMGRLTSALRSYREARAVFRRLGERSFLADVEQNLGNVLKDLGRYEQALGRLRAAERIRRSLGLRSEVARVLQNIGALSFQRGDYGQALQVLADARSIYESVSVGRGATEVDVDLLRTCIALNLREESRAVANRAIAGLRALEMPFELAQALLSAGMLAEASGDPDEARQRTDEARQVFVRTSSRVWESIARLQAARLVMGGGEPVEMRTALRHCQAATRRLQVAGALDHAAIGQLVEGGLLARLDAPTEAMKCFGLVLEAGTALGASHLLYQAHAAIARLHEQTAPETAIASYRLAIDHLEAVRARARADDLKVSFLADKADLYERIVGLLIARATSSAAAEEAFTFVERAKSRTLLEEVLAAPTAMPRGRQTRLGRLARRVRDLGARLNTAYTLAYGANEVPTQDGVARSAHAELVTHLEDEFARATRELQLAARAELPTPPTAGPTDEALPTGAALLEFYAVDGELIAFTRTDQGLRLRRLGTVAEAAQRADRLNFHLGKGAFGSAYMWANLDSLRNGINSCLRALWQALVAPLEADLAGVERLVVVPHGPLHGLPFHAFHDGSQYLAERFTVSYAPSAAVFQRCLRASVPPGGRALALAIEDPRLPWAGREIETVTRAWPNGRLLSGERATIRALKRRAGSFDVLHLATHAVFRADNPSFSCVKLSDGWLTVADLGELARGAQLVTLSACETGLSGLAVGDEVLGLTRAILGAGCTTIVASLWPVNDETTATLMEGFYSRVRGGAEPAEALRGAMLDLRAAADHPFFWAPFMVVGAGRGHLG